MYTAQQIINAGIEGEVNSIDVQHIVEVLQKLYGSGHPQNFLQCSVSRRFSAPFRVGRKQSRAVLDSKGLEVVIFPTGLESWALEYCRILNLGNGG